jgi:hypothetical protein
MHGKAQKGTKMALKLALFDQIGHQNGPLIFFFG